jgi:AAA domain
MAEQPITKRTFYAKVAVVGESGTGKSYLSKTANRETTGYINVERQPLPYKLPPFKFQGQPKTWAGFMKNLNDYIANPAISQIIVDSQSMAFDLLNKEMKKNFTNWDIAKNYNTQVGEYLDVIKEAQKDIIILSHAELVKIDDGSKKYRMVVHNKEYEGKIERHYTIVLFSGTRIADSKPQFFLKTFEVDTSTKVPEGLFADNLEIPNDAAFIFNTAKEYYSTTDVNGDLFK